MVDDAVNNGIGQDFVAKDLLPVFKGTVGGEDGGFGFIAGTDDFKEVVEGELGDFAEAQFVNNE